MSEFKLTSEIISRSVSKVWEVAKLEWQLSNIYEAEEPETCLCGHYPIIEICEIINSKNGNCTEVGNHCVKKFIGLRSDSIFQSLKKINKSIDKSVNAETLSYAHNKGWINDRDYQFYSDIIRKRNLSDKQEKWKIAINERIKVGIARSRKPKV